MTLFEASFYNDEAALLLFDQHKLIAVNQAAVSFLGTPTDELIGRDYQDFFPNADFDDHAVVQGMKLPSGKHLSVVSRRQTLGSGQLVVKIRSPLVEEHHLASEELVADTHHFRLLLEKLNDVMQELTHCKSLNDLYREAVALGQKHLGFDRLGILLIDHATQEQVGTWGIDTNGQLVDESRWRGPLENTAWLAEAIRNPKFCHFWDDVDLVNWGEFVGRGWNGMANLWDGERVFGWVSADNLIHQKPLTPAQQQVFRLFALNIGQLIVRKRAELALQQANAELENRIALKMQDLNDRLRELESVQQQLIEQEKHASLGNLVAGVAHEINTPLGNSQMAVSHLQYLSGHLQKQFALGALTKTELTQSIAEISEAASLLESNFRRAVELVRSFKQLATDQTDEQVMLVNLHDIIANVLSSFYNQYKNRPLSCFNQVASDIRFFCAPAKLTQIITNLLDNGLRHAFPADLAYKGRIGFSAELIGQQLRLVYADNGVGIHPDLIGKVFEPLRTSQRMATVGLGLTIIYQFVTQDFGGQVRCENTEPNGVRITVEFPVLLDSNQEDIA